MEVGNEPSYVGEILRIELEIVHASTILIRELDLLVDDLCLTHARLRVLQTIKRAGRALTVSQLARRMGVTRQSAQRIVNDLHTVEIVEFTRNPDHIRSPFVQLTATGENAYDEAESRRRRWATNLAESLDPRDLRRTLRVLRRLAALEPQAPADGG
jgi:DNA-binding MarR family transcriptional regulator